MDVDEFMDVLSGATAEDKSKDEMRSAFTLFDKEGKGYITVDNLKQVLRVAVWLIGFSIDSSQSNAAKYVYHPHIQEITSYLLLFQDPDRAALYFHFICFSCLYF